jgi:hypothetical protein
MAETRMPLKSSRTAGLKYCLFAGVVYAIIIASALFIRFRYSALHNDHLLFDIAMIWKVESGRHNTWITGTDGSIAYLYDLAYFMRRWPEHRNVLKIAAFNRALQKLGVQLILMPVPSEIHIYPERYIKNPGNLRSVQDDFLHQLADSGVQVVDLWRLFYSLRDSFPLYGKNNDHWAPLAIERAAGLLRKNHDIEIRATGADTCFVQDWHELRTDIVRPNARFDTIHAHIPIPTVDDSITVLIIGDSYSNFWEWKGCDIHSYIKGSKRLSLRLGLEGPTLIDRVPGPYLRKYKYVVWVFAERHFSTDFVARSEVGGRQLEGGTEVGGR